MPFLKKEKDLLVKQLPQNKTKRKTCFAIQATMFSKVFHGKVLAKFIDNRTVLDFLVTRIREAGLAGKIAIVTSNLNSDLPIVKKVNVWELR